MARPPKRTRRIKEQETRESSQERPNEYSRRLADELNREPWPEEAMVSSYTYVS